MRILVLSDFARQCHRFRNGSDAANGRWDRVVCLGDVVGYGPGSQRSNFQNSRTGRANNPRKSRQAATGLMATTISIPGCKSGGGLDALATVSRKFEMAS